MINITYLLLSNSKKCSRLWTIYIHWIHVQFFTWGCGYTHIRDSWFVAIHKNSLSMDPNDEWRMWTIWIFFPHYSRITYESRITHYEYAHKVAAPRVRIRDSWEFKTCIFYSYKIAKQCKWTYSLNLHSSFNICVNWCQFASDFLDVNHRIVWPHPNDYLSR